MKQLLSALVAIFLCSCASSQPGKGVEVPPYAANYTVYLKGEPELSSMSDAREIFGDDAKIYGTTVDMDGGMISGKKMKHYADTQDERNPGIKIRVEDFILKNGFVSDIPGGLISFAGGTRFENISFLDIGEDAVSNQKDVSKGFQVINCKFYNTSKGDKSIQANDARDALIKGNFISGGITAVRVQKDSAKRHGETMVVGNTFQNVNTGLNIAGRGTVTLKDNKFIGVPKPFIKGPNAKVKEL